MPRRLLSAGCDTADESVGERYTRALMRMAREIWRPDYTLERAIAGICEDAARALRVDRVNLWRYDAPGHRLIGMHAYTRAGGGRHFSRSELETVVVTPEYEAALNRVRAIDMCDTGAAAPPGQGPDSLHMYLSRHRIGALVDAPVLIDGEQLGVICNEHVGGAREWTGEEKTFAASVGDFVAIAHQIARRRRAEHEIAHLRLHDATTGLPNRDCMVELLSQRLRLARGGTPPVAVVHLRIDARRDLALTPEACTHDALMIEAARALERDNAGRDEAVTLGRGRADAFVLLPRRQTGQAQVLRLAQRSAELVRALPHGADTPQIDAVAGIAFAEPDELDARVLMRKAEQAAKRAQQAGDARVEVFDLQHHQELMARMRDEQALRAAFEDGALEMHYQPEYDHARGRWSAAEALVRWRHPDGLRAAATFIELAESTGLIVPLGLWALREACAQAAGWDCVQGPVPTLRVNVSARQFEQPSLTADVARALADTGLDAARLCLEITETTLMRDASCVLDQLRDLQSLGVRLAIDDFGTGYSSLTYIKHLPVATLKLDRGFVSGLPEDAADCAIVEAVVALARALGLDVVAEGVETDAQADALLARGVSRHQGWFYARAMPADAVRALFAALPGVGAGQG